MTGGESRARLTFLRLAWPGLIGALGWLFWLAEPHLNIVSDDLGHIHPTVYLILNTHLLVLGPAALIWGVFALRRRSYLAAALDVLHAVAAGAYLVHFVF